MIRYRQLQHRFVEHLPEALEPGVLYISLTYGSVAHTCCCGCGEEVVTPLTPTDWRIIYDGETVSLEPSVGSWSLPCRSHYVIDRGRVIEALPWTEEQIAAERWRDHHAKQNYYGRPDDERPAGFTKSEPAAVPTPSLACSPKRWHERVTAYLRKAFGSN